MQQARIDRPSTFVIATAAPRHHELLRKLGAHAVFDYRSPTLAQDVRGLGRDVTRALDCHSEGDSTVRAAQCMVRGDGAEAKGVEGRVIRTLPPSMMKGSVPQGIRADEWILSYTALGKVRAHGFVAPNTALYCFRFETSLLLLIGLPTWGAASPSGSSSNITLRRPRTIGLRRRIWGVCQSFYVRAPCSRSCTVSWKAG